MRAFVLIAMIAVASTGSGSYRAATVAERSALSTQIANYVHYRDFGTVNPFGTASVELGTTAVYVDKEGFAQEALADWRSEDRRRYGQVQFYYLCDHWNTGAVSSGRSLHASEMGGIGTSRQSFAGLIAELSRLEQRTVAFLPPVHFTSEC